MNRRKFLKSLSYLLPVAVAPSLLSCEKEPEVDDCDFEPLNQGVNYPGVTTDTIIVETPASGWPNAYIWNADGTISTLSVAPTSGKYKIDVI